MFWIGFASGVVAAVVFLITEHLMGQLSPTQRMAFFKSLFAGQKTAQSIKSSRHDHYPRPREGQARVAKNL